MLSRGLGRGSRGRGRNINVATTLIDTPVAAPPGQLQGPSRACEELGSLSSVGKEPPMEELAVAAPETGGNRLLDMRSLGLGSVSRGRGRNFNVATTIIDFPLAVPPVQLPGPVRACEELGSLSSVGNEHEKLAAAATETGGNCLLEMRSLGLGSVSRGRWRNINIPTTIIETPVAAPPVQLPGPSQAGEELGSLSAVGKVPCMEELAAATETGGNRKKVVCVGGWEDSENLHKGVRLLSMRRTPAILARQPRYAIHRYHFVNVRVVKVEDPGYFHMEYILPKREKQEANMQDFYNGKKQQKPEKMLTCRPFKGQTYVFLDTDGKFKRVRVECTNFQAATVTARYLDEVWRIADIPIEDLYECPPIYGFWPKYPLAGGLAGIAPSEEAGWSQQATEYFKELTLDKIFIAYPIEKKVDPNDKRDVHSRDDKKVYLSAYLFPKDGGVLINALMTLEGHATPVGHDESEFQDFINDFHPDPK